MTKKLVVTIIVFILAMNGVFAQQTMPGRAKLAEAYTSMFFQKQLDELFAKMDTTFQKRMKSADELAAFYQEVISFTGEPLTFEAQDTSFTNNIFVSKQTARGSKDVVIEITWALGNDGVIKGFSIRPKRTEAPSNYLSYQSKTKLRLPFSETWSVFSGGRTLATNHHAVAKNQRFANDMAIAVDGKTHSDDGKQLTDYYVWGKPVLAPAEGTIVRLVDGFPDNPIGTTDTKNVAGNYLVIDHGNGEFSFLAHFQKDSFSVRQGDKVKTGQRLGLAGNSGNTSEPHLHYHLQDGPDFPEAECMPAAFHDYFANGVLIESGELAQGQQVKNADR